jgi:hypothetical protein
LYHHHHHHHHHHTRTDTAEDTPNELDSESALQQVRVVSKKIVGMEDADVGEQVGDCDGGIARKRKELYGEEIGEVRKHSIH